MSYIVLARKYRPQNFDEVIGQETITTTLKNAIQQNRIAHAYLFAGPRGIGKTSTARIFAKSLNCQDGPTAKPCQKCTSCAEITSGASMDVIEIDGASNRGIDEIRNLRENVKFGAMHGKYKIYIIDEVHMLTIEAFNALLKTLEEPPAHVKFIFATTQPHKIPATIVSRCQRFDFKRIPTDEIISKLKDIVKKENMDVADDALLYIARAAEGSLRDAETILDQLASFCEGSIKKQDVYEALGIIEDDKICSLVDAVAKKDVKTALSLVDTLVKDGKDLAQFTSSLVEHIRNLLVAKVGKDLDKLIDLPPHTIEKIAEQSKEFSVESLLYIIYLLMNTKENIRKTESSRIPLETALVKLTAAQNIMPLDQLLGRLEELERRFSSAGPAPSAIPKNAANNKTINEPKAFNDNNHDEQTAPSDVKVAVETAQDQEQDIAGVGADKIEEIWLSLLKIMRNKKISVASYLLEGKIHSIDGNTFTIGFPKNYQFHRESLDKPEHRALIEDTLKEILKKDARVKLITFDYAKEMESQAALNPPSFQAQEEATEPIIQSALHIFKGRVVQKRKNTEKADGKL